jgi:hypothetical protein
MCCGSILPPPPPKKIHPQIHKKKSTILIQKTVDAAFPEAACRPGYRYVFTFDGERVTLAERARFT